MDLIADIAEKRQSLSLLGFEPQSAANPIPILTELEKPEGKCKFNTEHAMKIYGGVKVKIHSFFPALRGNKWSVACPRLFNADFPFFLVLELARIQ
jgi:hypothetical protein